MSDPAGRKKIAIVVPDFLHGGGVPAVARFLFNELQRIDRYEPAIVSIATSRRDLNSSRILSPLSFIHAPGVTSCEVDDVAIDHVGSHAAEIEFFRYRPRRALDEVLNRFDLVQIVAGGPAWGGVAKRFRGPVLLQVATLAAVERKAMSERGSILRRLWTKIITPTVSHLETDALRDAQVVFVENRWMEEHAIRAGAKRVIYAPPGVDTSFFVPDTRVQRRTLLTVCRLDDPRKNLELMIEAYAEACARWSQTPELILAGKNDLPSSAYRLINRFGLDSRIVVEKNVSKERLRTLYREAAAFLLSSDEEGLGIALLEAMASGAYAIATACGGPEEIVRDERGGTLVPIRNAHLLAERITEFLARPQSEREAASRDAREVVEERYSAGVAAKRFISVYDELVG